MRRADDATNNERRSGIQTDSDCLHFRLRTRNDPLPVATSGLIPRLTPNGREVWGVDSHSALERWEIVEDGESGAAELKLVIFTGGMILSWQSPRGHEVTDDGWVLSPTRKRLLWLPHRGRRKWEYRLWSGRFLGLLHGELLGEATIELFE